MFRVVSERVCLALFFAWLALLPLPFGSVIEQVRLPLVGVPLALGIVAVLMRLHATRDRTNTAPARPWIFWGIGGLLFTGVALLQLVPLPPDVLRALSPESHAIWSAASQVAELAGVRARDSYPITIDPRATLFEAARISALLATFSVAALLVRTHARRMTLAAVLSIAALFEVFYGVREAALQRYAIWGWVNKLVFNRVTGTFVNPNHFGHYVAIVLPMAVFIGAIAWREAGARHAPPSRRLVLIAERRLWPALFSVLATLACVVGVMLSQSRGALLALASGALAIAAFVPGRRPARIALAAGAGLALLAALVLFLGPERTVARFVPTELERRTLVGRRLGLASATALWQRFPLLGSGLGTFERVASMEQPAQTDRLFHHAHNDYAELAATSGTVGFAIALIALFGGYLGLLRMTFGKEAEELSWRRRAFQAAALASLTIAMVHALFDFNFFIPSNPATLATIAGAAVATLDRDRRTRL